ncbi:hypothetical protein [Salinimicrobium sp. HB62]|uniref:hypothetical protein n=1 Tax=Salinimicrobium sp. HB62 TaxID=3077781 RepID=UPI002D7668D6|nr:hypothetical protein [Salinimicrobium sp. HB62]
MTYEVINRKIDKFILVIIVIMMSGASLLNDHDELLIIIFTLMGSAMLARKQRINPFIIGVIVLWLFINIISFLYNETGLSLNTFLGYLLRLLIPFFGLKLIGITFWEKLENLIYKMALLTIPIFILDLIFPEIFNALKPIFEPLTSNTFYRKESQSSYWYSFFYTHSGREGIRNSGFMWEPGAFAMVLVLMIIYNWCTKGFRFSKRVWIYSILIITTFSTAGYLALAFLLVAYVQKAKKLHVSVISMVLLIVFVLVGRSMDFLGPKIERFLSETENNILYEQGYSNRYEANRVAYFLINLTKSIELPTGYGVVEDKESFFSVQKIVGVNGLGDILLMWGWLGLLFVLFSIFKFCSAISTVNLSYFTIFLLSIAILITFFSNPIETNPILFLVVFTPHIFKIKEQLHEFDFQQMLEDHKQNIAK